MADGTLHTGDCNEGAPKLFVTCRLGYPVAGGYTNGVQKRESCVERQQARAALLEREASPVLDRWLADVYSHDRSPTRGLT